MVEMSRISKEAIGIVTGGQHLYYEHAEAYLFKAMGAKAFNCYVDEGIDPFDVAEEHLSPQQMAELRDILENGTASRYYVPW